MQLPSPKLLKDILILRTTLQKYHPLIIEGHGHSRDKRDPAIVAQNIIHSLQQQYYTTPTGTSENNNNNNNNSNNSKNRPLLLITQGDPLESTGISAITRHVADGLQIQKCLVTLDEDIDPNHAIMADRYKVDYEVKYSQLLELMNQQHNNIGSNDGINNDDCIENGQDDPHQLLPIATRLEHAIDRELHNMNQRRMQQYEKQQTEKQQQQQQPPPPPRPLATWYKDYAMLQEVTKSAMKMASGGQLTLVHTVPEISDFSVTSFYKVGLDLGLVGLEDIVPYYNYYHDDNGDTGGDDQDHGVGIVGVVGRGI